MSQALFLPPSFLCFFFNNQGESVKSVLDPTSKPHMGQVLSQGEPCTGSFYLFLLIHLAVPDLRYRTLRSLMWQVASLVAACGI